MWTLSEEATVYFHALVFSSSPAAYSLALSRSG